MAMTLRAARVNANLTQEQAAKLMGVSANTVSKWEIGKATPNIKRIPIICETYGLNGYDDIIFLPDNNA